MKTLDEILARDSYQKLTTVSRGRAREIAGRIKNKMLSLEVNEITLNGISLCIMRGRTNYGYYEYLAINTDDSNFYCIDGAFNGYIHGDYNHPCSAASNKDVLSFLNNARGFIEALGKIETGKARTLRKALEDSGKLLDEIRTI